MHVLSAFDTYGAWVEERADGRPYGTLVWRAGEVLLERYGCSANDDTAWEIGSIRKAAGCALLGMAVDEGRIELDGSAHEIWPEICEQPKDREIRVRHLFESTSGWKRPEPPGTKWVYNNAAFTAGGVVLGRVYGAEEDRIAPLVQERLADRIGATSWKCTHYPGAFSDRFGNPGPKLAIDSNMQDLVKFGRLWLGKGAWEGDQVFPEAHAVAATTNRTRGADGHYGYCWFTNDGRVLLPDAPEDAFFHVGNGKEERRTVLLVVPSLQLVAAVGVDRRSYDITDGYSDRPVPHVNEWAGWVLRGLAA